MKYCSNGCLSFLRNNALEACFLSLIFLSLITLFQTQIASVIHTYGIEKQVIQIKDITASDQPLNLGKILYGKKTYLKINFEFQSVDSPGYPNLFQTDVLNGGIRAELNGSTLALIFSSPNEKGSPKLLILSDKLIPGQWYSFHLEALNGAFITSGVSEAGSSYSASESPEFGTESFKVGIGYDDHRRFRGEIRNVVITKASVRPAWVVNLILYPLEIALLVLVIVCFIIGRKYATLKQVRHSRILILHFICQIAGISYLANADDTALKQLFDLGAPIYAMIPWHMPPHPPTTNSLLAYILLLAVIVSLLFVSFAKNGWQRRQIISGELALGLLIAYEVSCLALPFVIDSLVGLWVWLAFVSLLPAYVFFNRSRLHSPIVAKFALTACLVLIGGVVGNLLSTSWNPGLRFVNDYADLPEYTTLKNGQKVENRSFLQEHSVKGEYAYDPCESVEKTLCMHLPRSVFANERASFNMFPPGGGLIYDWDKEVLKAYRSVTDEDLKKINGLWGITYKVDKNANNNSDINKISPEVNEFLFKNRMELGAQMNLGRFFYHHAFLYLPALEIAKSLATKVTPAQYGAGLTQTLGTLLHMGGAPNFQTYYKIFWAALITYLVLLGAIVAWIAKDIWAGIAASAIGIICVLSVAPDALRMAPGFNPMRHLPDLLCLVVIFIDSRRNTYLSAFLRAVAMAFFVWWNREFGIFLLFGSITWHLFTVVVDYHQWRAGFGRVAIEGILSTIVLAMFGAGEGNGLAFYNLMGVGTPLTRWHDVIFWMAIWVPAIGVAVWGRFIWSSKSPEQTNNVHSLLDVSGVGLIYSGFTTVYALWNPSPNHYAVVALTAVLPFAMIFIWVHQSLSARDVQFSWLPKFIATIATIMLLPFTYHDNMLFQEYDKIFKDHRTFTWHFPGLTGITTADPEPLEQSKELVDKYQPEGRVLFVSRYDTLMNTMLNRSGILPYVDIPSSIVSWSMIDKIGTKINKLKPTYIFVDRDLQADREWGVTSYSPDKSVVTPIQNRAGSLAALNQVFQIILPCYAPGESKGVLQVWHRTCK